MKPLIDVTGNDELCPVCPIHPSVALLPEPRQGKDYWRCPVDHRIYSTPQ